MRNAQKNALMALFAAMEDSKAEDRKSEPALPFEPKSGRPIALDPLWLLTRGAKGRA